MARVEKEFARHFLTPLSNEAKAVFLEDWVEALEPYTPYEIKRAFGVWNSGENRNRKPSEQDIIRIADRARPPERVDTSRVARPETAEERQERESGKSRTAQRTPDAIQSEIDALNVLANTAKSKRMGPMKRNHNFTGKCATEIQKMQAEGRDGTYAASALAKMGFTSAEISEAIKLVKDQAEEPAPKRFGG